MQPKCPHGRELCAQCVVITDAGKRAYDIIKGYVAFIPHDQRVRSWVALRLEDGGSDGELYESKRDAVRHQVNEFLCAYFSYRNSPSGFASTLDAQLYLNWNRALYDRGMRLPDPDDKAGGPDLITPLTMEDYAAQLNKLISR
jgi:hypothetical protein